MATRTIEKEVLERERVFWDAMKIMDADKAVEMTDERCIIAGAQGVAAIDPKTMGELMKGATWKLHSYSMDDKNVQVRTIGDNVAIVAYRVSEDLTVDGERLTLEAFDTSVWVREGNDWRCALHTESPAGDPFGRDKQR